MENGDVRRPSLTTTLVWDAGRRIAKATLFAKCSTYIVLGCEESLEGGQRFEPRKSW